MNQKVSQPIDLAQAEARLREWCKKYDTPEKVAAEHQKMLLKWVSESMAFEGQPVSKARLKALLRKEAQSSC